MSLAAALGTFQVVSGIFGKKKPSIPLTTEQKTAYKSLTGSGVNTLKAAAMVVSGNSGIIDQGQNTGTGGGGTPETSKNWFYYLIAAGALFLIFKRK